MTQGSERERLERSYPKLRRFAAVVAPADVDPDDLVQEAMVRALRVGLDRIDDLDAYLRRAVVNLASNERRRWARALSAFRRIKADDAAVAASYVDAADLLRVAPEARAVLWLSEIEGWSYAEIGRVVGCTEQAARARASRARRQLRVELAGEWT